MVQAATTMNEHMSADCNSGSLRKSMSAFATGVAVVTAHVDGRDIGMTINSFTSLSMDPPLVLWNLRKSSPLLQSFQHCTHYAIHVLSIDQLHLSRQFSAADERFRNVALERGVANTPLIAHCCAIFECSAEHVYDGGDHVIFVGRIQRHAAVADRAPLVFHAGRYQRIDSTVRIVST